MNKLIAALTLVLFLIPTATDADPPSSRGSLGVPGTPRFRPETFARPSPAIQRLRTGSSYGGYSSSVFRNNRPSYGVVYNVPLSFAADYYSPSSSAVAASSSAYYQSVIGNYGANPYSGLDASLRLYQNSRRPTGSMSNDFSWTYYYEDSNQYGRIDSFRGR